MDELTESVSDNLKRVRAERYAEIDKTLSMLTDEFNCTNYLYFLLEPDVDLIRYVGICSDPRGRFNNHTTDRKSRTPVAAWLKSLKERGELPRMWVVGEVATHRWHYLSHIDCSCVARAAEKAIVCRCCHGQYFGNGHLESSLLNVEYMPQKILGNGIDARKDHA